MNLTAGPRSIGFTLVELMVTVTVVVIVLAFSIPVIQGLLARTRLTQVTNSLVSHLQFARSAAVRRGRDRVAVGPYGSDGGWDSGDAWQGGYMVATVASGSTPTIQEVLRRVDAGDLASVTITTNAASSRFYFLPDGTSSVSATLTICDRTRAASPRAVVVDNVGRIRASDYRPGGDPLTCPSN